MELTDTSALAGTVDARLHPIEVLKGPKPHDVEWVVDLGIGGGRVFEDTALPLSASAFRARLGTGLDFTLGDHWSLYVDGGCSFASSSEACGFACRAGGIGYRFQCDRGTTVERHLEISTLSISRT